MQLVLRGRAAFAFLAILFSYFVTIQGFLELNYSTYWNKTGELLLFHEDFEGPLGRWSGVDQQSLEADPTTAATGLFSGKLVGSNHQHRQGFYADLCPCHRNGSVPYPRQYKCHHRPSRLSFYIRTDRPDLSGPYVTLTEIINGTLVPAVSLFAFGYRILYNFVDSSGSRYISAGVPFEANVWFKVDVTIDWNNPMTAVKIFINNALAECNLPLRNGAATLSVGRLDAYNFDSPVGWLDDIRVYLRDEGNHWTEGFCENVVNLVPRSETTERTFGTFLPPFAGDLNNTELMALAQDSLVLSDHCDPPCGPRAVCLPGKATQCPPPMLLDVEETTGGGSASNDPMPTLMILGVSVVMSLATTVALTLYRRWSRRRDAALAAARAAAIGGPPGVGAVPLGPNSSHWAGAAGGTEDMP
eukprot:TRINITY_DN7445_c1_g1_i3.p1 TRINITY_DN7445_c1_g1~~TRINITY_DN7445_c1_g1_i3.p1  ORF type:complete len:415 (-),score=113.10 TRINITY_DN7445_c1_g1_i3:235-1479(-)